MDIQAYLRRIKYSGPLAPTADTLRELHKAHLMSVPFENIDIHTGQRIILDESRVYKKIVERRRGGFCYELNGAFRQLLAALGFDVTMLSAGVARKEGGFGPDFSHMTLLVKLEDRWLADVGFGDSFREPLLLDEPSEQEQDGRAYRIARDGQHLMLQRRDDSGAWEPQYRFTLAPRLYAEYEGMCHYHQTSPESHFTQKRVCTLATPEGRITLSDMLLITTAGSERRERLLESQQEYDATLKQHFDIDLSRH